MKKTHRLFSISYHTDNKFCNPLKWEEPNEMYFYMIYTVKRDIRFTFYDFGLKHLKILCLLPFSVPVSRYSIIKDCLPSGENKESWQRCCWLNECIKLHGRKADGHGSQLKISCFGSGISFHRAEEGYVIIIFNRMSNLPRYSQCRSRRRAKESRKNHVFL